LGVDVSGRVEPTEDVQAELAAAMRARRGELEETIFVRLRDAAYDAAGDEDAEYAAGLREAIAEIVDYGLTRIERGGSWAGSLPPAVVAQTQRAARAGVSLDTVLRRCVAGGALLGDFMMQAADRGDLKDHGGLVRDMLSAQATMLDRLMAAVTSEYTREVERAGRAPGRRREECVQRLLAGAPVDAAELGYELDGWHIGVIATGAKADRAVRDLAEGLGRQLLTVPRSAESVWAWLGGRRRLAVRDVERVLGTKVSADVSLTVGEPAVGIEGFRLTHRQAQEALWVALRSPQRLTRYSDVLLLAPALRNDVLARSLEKLLLSPLGSQKEGGAVLRQTLRALFDAGHNVNAAAATLGVDRGTVRKRRRIVEQRLGRPLHTCQAELEVALRLEELQECGAGETASARQVASASSLDSPTNSD
jgi:diguanylate cyclase with GGDEF domain/PucR-like helix-turn-helix protein